MKRLRASDLRGKGIDLFERSPDGGTYTLAFREFFAVVHRLYGCWGWVLYRAGVAVAGRRTFDLTAADACAETAEAVADWARKGGAL